VGGLAVLVVLAGPARAAWQNTHWGMTPAELRTANGPGVTDAGAGAPDNPFDHTCRTLLAQPYVSGSLRFQAFYLFDSRGGLCDVVLRLEIPAELPLLNAALKDKYGQPDLNPSLQALGITRWTNAGGDIVEMIAIEGIAPSVQYRPRATANNSGL